MSARAKTILKTVLIALCVAVAAMLAVCAWYVSDYAPADELARACVYDDDGSGDGVTVRVEQGRFIAFVPADATYGLVFYPGAKVQPESYAPLMLDLARDGILSVIVIPPFNLAFLNIGAAETVIGAYPAVTHWVASGHSLGGVAACECVSHHPDDFDAIALMASYPACDLSGFDGPLVSIVGTNDGVLNWDAYNQAKASLPPAARELVIEGGNHAGFGNYGPQERDMPADIPREDQQAQTAEAIRELLAD